MRKFFLFFLFNLLILKVGLGQISTNALYSDTTRYPVFRPNSKLFVFPPNTNVQLTAQSRDTLIPRHRFIWTRYITADTNFTDTLQTDLDTTISVLSLQAQGCYKVNIIDSAGKDSSYTAWVFFDSISFRVDSISSLCTGLRFKLNNIKLDTIRYFDLQTQQQITLPNPYNIKWKFNGAEAEPLFSTFDTKAPVDTITYYATIKNAYNNSHTESYKIWRPIATKADFIVNAKDSLYGKSYYQFTGDSSSVVPKGGAPLPVSLINKSKNGEKFEWYFASSYHDSNFIAIPIEEVPYKPSPTVFYSVRGVKGTISDPKDSAYTTYYFPGKYSIKLVSKNSTCDLDSFVYKSPDAKTGEIYSVEVYYSKQLTVGHADIPKAFIPSEGNDLRNFRFNLSLSPAEGLSLTASKWYAAEASIRDMSLKIFDRWGRIVYKYDGALEWPDTQDGGWEAWTGWNGKINNTGSDCYPGVYFYVIEFKGWDDKVYTDVLNPKNASAGAAPTTPTTAPGGSTAASDYVQKNPRRKTNVQYTGSVYLIR